MLVLGRKLNEKILINGNIEITIIKVDRNQVRIGINAPRDVRVVRSELEDRFSAGGATELECALSGAF